MLPEENEKMPEDLTGIATPVMFWLEENYQQKFSLARLAEDLGNRAAMYRVVFCLRPVNIFTNTSIPSACEKPANYCCTV
jgi:hypothetical protein